VKGDRAATLQQIVATIQRRWGTRALRILGAPAHDPALPVVSSGFAEIDAALHIGGLLRGRLTELLGTPTSGMTTLALTVLACAQAQSDLVAYLLAISPIDPLAHDLVFERFLSDERPSLPDIDIDFAADRRTEIIEYVYRRYGHDHAAMACTFSTFQSRSALRDVAHALDLPPALLG